MAMDKKTYELTAIGASVAGGCVPCLKYHLNAAREAGAMAMEIEQAMAIGELIREQVKKNLDVVIKGMNEDSNKDNKCCIDKSNTCCDS